MHMHTYARKLRLSRFTIRTEPHSLLLLGSFIFSFSLPPFQTELPLKKKPLVQRMDGLPDRQTDRNVFVLFSPRCLIVTV